MNTITINRTIQQSVAIPLPYYAKESNGNRLYAVVSERTVLCAVVLEGAEGIYNSHVSLIPEGIEQISEEAFAQAFQKAKLALDKRFAETCPSLQVAA